ncbi:TniQ family protein [Nonomuraea dietziae]|uniref:TniQ family protein n=1 Tax=Nonomuraea dietziae TaxID=65515 RepID=UPI0034474AB4
MSVTRGIRHWPIHPRPHPGEALTSWLGRLAAAYRLSVRQLLQYNLGPAFALLDEATAGDLDWDPPLALLEALALRTGTEVGELRLMTVAGWVPWLADTLDPAYGPEAFHPDTRQDSVLLSPGEAGTNAVERWLPWLSADRPQPVTREISGWSWAVRARDPRSSRPRLRLAAARRGRGLRRLARGNGLGLPKLRPGTK